MGTWTLTHGTDTRSLADWGMSQAVIRQVAFAAGTFTAQLAGYMTAAVPWVYTDTVVIALDGVTQFVGTVMDDEGEGAAENESIQFTAVDPWWWLGQGAYSQEIWDRATMAALQSARVALFAEVNAGVGWSVRSIAAEIAAIIAHCNTLYGGGIMQLGTLAGDGWGICPLPQRLENATHESALRKALQWVPDAVPSWDFSTTPPTLNITQRAAATARTYTFCDGQAMMSQQIKARNDMLVLGVHLVYWGLDATGQPWMIADAAGATSGRGVVEATIDCTGNSGGGGPPPTPNVQPEVGQTYEIESAAIKVNDPNWWFQNADCGVESVGEIYQIDPRTNIAMDPDAPENEGKSGLGGCDLQWLSGGIPRSLAANHTRMALVTGYLILHQLVYDPDGVWSQAITTARIVQVRCPTTDLSGESSLLVKDQEVTMPGGAAGIATIVPTGIAAKLLAAWGVLQYDGAFRITKDECNELVTLGNVVNWTGGDTDWQTMNAQVKQITRNIDTGTTDITLGVADHLALDEFASLLRVGTMGGPIGGVATDLQQQATGDTPTGDTTPTTINDLVSPGRRTSSSGDCCTKIVINVPGGQRETVMDS